VKNKTWGNIKKVQNIKKKSEQVENPLPVSLQTMPEQAKVAVATEDK